MTVGADAPLSEEGYQAVAAAKNTGEMEVFVRRTIAEMGLRLDDAAQLHGFAMWYSGEAAVQSNKRLRQELLEMKWVSVASLSGDNVPLTEEGYQQLAALKNTPQMVRMIQRVMIDSNFKSTDVDRINGLAAWYSGESAVQSLARLREELSQLDWVEKPTDSWWKPDLNLDGHTSESRAKWLIENQGLSEYAARTKIRAEFPAAFGPGVAGTSAKFGERFSAVPFEGGGKHKLRIEVRPREAEGVSLVAVHYSVNGGAELNFDIRQFDAGAHAWVHETPSGAGFPDVPPGSTIRYWLYLIRNGVGEQEPANATSGHEHRLEVKL